MQSLLLCYIWLESREHFPSHKTKLQLNFNSENQAQAYILQLISSYSDGRTCRLVIKIRGSVTAFAAM